uniref:tyrosine-protein phosphatase non-receptor type substrate 1-like n=1 Tax=Euleptes europaea TaxID=460621 RepID=UPI00253FE13B|nr:tyrosine-protein phosphatase non-receptor type substrate 1-like [Euleptes europaea]
MRGSRAAFPWPLLLLLQSTWAVLKVEVPQSSIRALPLSDLRLSCNFSDPRPVTLTDLAVFWKRDQETVAKYLAGKFTATRPRAEMSDERLRAGDASLLLPRIQDADSGVYTCVVVFTPEKDEGSFDLKLEAEPHVALGSTKLQLGKRAALTCTASGFYPGNITVEWLKDGAVVEGPRTSLHHISPNGLYNASSVWELTPGLADSNANFSCRVRHQSLEGPLKEDFQIQLQALPSLQVFTFVSGDTLEVLRCLASGFYPQDVHIRWLRNGAPQPPTESLPQTLPNGTFSMQSVLWLQETDPRVSYICQVQHKVWDAPLELAAPWQPKGEGDGLPCPTPQRPQSSGTEVVPCSCSLTLTHSSPASATGTVAIWTWPVLVLGFALCLLGGVMLCLTYRKRKNKSYPDTKVNQNPESVNLNPASEEAISKTENDFAPSGTTTSM